MKNKIITAKEAVAGLRDGMTVFMGGFLATGSPEVLIDAVLETGVKNLTVVGNDGGLPVGAYGATKARGICRLVDAGVVSHLVASHVGMTPIVAEKVNAGEMKLTLVPQGTLAEKIRAAAYGLGGVLTPTGVGTPVQDALDELGREKKVMEINGKKYLFEMPFHGDYSLIRPSVADKFGNYYCAKATKNFNYVMAGASTHTIIAPEKIVEINELDPDTYDVPGVLVDYIVEGEKKWQI
ncbi:MAG: CoA transferase subunit A [Firmicutes bacterium]|nr:CoA transferase subunit A [Bacillota bacterium]